MNRRAIESVVAMTALLALALGACGSGKSSRAVIATPPQAPVGTPPAESTPAEAARKPAAKPNIVFVLTDDLAWNLVRYMPHVRAMSTRGETFSNYYVTDSLCCPSRASILTGRFPHNTKIFGNVAPHGGFIPFHNRGEELNTFATSLQRVGYRTALMGKYLNGYQPSDVEEGKTTPFIPPGWTEWDGVGDGYPEYGYVMNSNGRLHRYGFRPKDYLTDVLAEKGLSFIARSAREQRPFMMEIATFAPHAPFVPAPRDATDFPGLLAPRTPSFDVTNQNPPAWLSRFKPLTRDQVLTMDEEFRRRAQAVQAIDEMIGEIENELKEYGLARNTYIVFSSDNGLHIGEHRLLSGKLTAFDSDIRVPLMVVGPGVPHGKTVTALTENIDLCPTFDQLGGAPIPSSVDGHSLASVLHGEPAVHWRKEVLVEHRGPDITPNDPDLPTEGAGNPPSYEALRTRHALYVDYGDGEREYYNLRHDPFEIDNLAGRLSPARRHLLDGAITTLARCHGQTQCWAAAHSQTSLSSVASAASNRAILSAGRRTG